MKVKTIGSKSNKKICNWEWKQLKTKIDEVENNWSCKQSKLKTIEAKIIEGRRNVNYKQFEVTTWERTNVVNTTEGQKQLNLKTIEGWNNLRRKN